MVSAENVDFNSLEIEQGNQFFQRSTHPWSLTNPNPFGVPISGRFGHTVLKTRTRKNEQGLVSLDRLHGFSLVLEQHLVEENVFAHPHDAKDKEVREQKSDGSDQV